MTIPVATTRSPFVYASALAIDVATMQLVPEADSVTHETEVVLARVGARLAASGLDLGDVVKTTCYLTDESHLAEFSAAYERAFAERLPVTCTVFLGLAGNCRVQMDAVAARRHGLAS
jgi:2-iminobutanoate/2-iminopropanoate deaminase